MQVRGAKTVRWMPSDGHSPYVGENGNWWQWNDKLQRYVDTGISAKGIPGMPGKSPFQKEWKAGDTHRNDTNIVDYIYVRAPLPDDRKWYKLKNDYVVREVPSDETYPSESTLSTYYDEIPWLKELAASVLIAEGANIANFIFQQGMLRSQSGTSGLNGVEGSNNSNPVFWSGGTYEQAIGLIEFLHHISLGTPAGTGAGQFDYATKYASLAKITMLHDGTAKTGDFIIEPDGRIIIVDPLTGKPKIIFSATNIPLLEDLLSATEFSGTSYGDAVYNITPGDTPVILATLSGVKEGSKITFKADQLYFVSESVYSTDPRMGTTFRIDLFHNGVFYTSMGRIVNPANGYTLHTYSDIDWQTEGVPAGDYSVRFSIETTPCTISAYADISESEFHWEFRQAGIRWFQLGKNGIMAFYSDNHMYFTEEEGLDVKGKTNIPGILLSGTVGLSGNPSHFWGAKKSTKDPVKTDIGRYTIYHTVGHVSYQVFASSLEANRSHRIVTKNEDNFIIEWKSIGSSPTKQDNRFDFMIVGDNY